MTACLIFLALGCQPKVKVPPVPDIPVAPTEEPPQQARLIPILMDEAAKFAGRGNIQDALLVYNQALEKAAGKGAAGQEDQQAVLAAMEAVLKLAPAGEIAEFSAIRNLTVPDSLLLYWLGVAHAREENHAAARAELETFIFTYPDDPRLTQARDLLESVRLAAFDRRTIGCLLPLSGKYSIYGERALKGIQLAVQDLSETHGVPFKVIVKDTRSDSDHAAQCVEELARDEVLGILGPLLAPDSAGQKAQALKVPLIALTQKQDFPFQGDYLFSNFITPEMQVQALGSYIFGTLGLKRVAILYPDERYGRRYMELFWDVVDAFDGEVVGVEAYDGKKTDFTKSLQKLTGAYYPLPEFLEPEPEEPGSIADGGAGATLENGRQSWQGTLSARGSAVASDDRIEIDFQALFIPDGLSRVNLILPQLAFNDARGMVLLGTNLWHQKSLLTQAKGYNKNTVISDGYFGGSQNPATAEFDQKFRAVFQRPPGFLEAIAYDTASILFAAASEPEVDSREGIRDMLRGKLMFDGVTGQTLFDPSGSPRKELFLITVKRGKFMEIRRSQ